MTPNECLTLTECILNTHQSCVLTALFQHLVVTGLVLCKTAATLAHILCKAYNHAPVYSFIQSHIIMFIWSLSAWQVLIAKKLNTFSQRNPVPVTCVTNLSVLELCWSPTIHNEDNATLSLQWHNNEIIMFILTFWSFPAGAALLQIPSNGQLRVLS